MRTPSEEQVEPPELTEEPTPLEALAATAETAPPAVRGLRLRTLPALAVASMLVAGGLLMAVGGLARLVGPAPATPIPTIAPTAADAVSPAPTQVPPIVTLPPGQTAAPHG
jgi:hypothetical protein